MAGAATLLMQAQLNMRYQFVSRPQYWISFGHHTKGEVIDVDTVTTPAQIKFPVNTHSMTAILNADATWTVKPTWQVNNAFIEALGKNKNTLFGVHDI